MPVKTYTPFHPLHPFLEHKGECALLLVDRVEGRSGMEEKIKSVVCNFAGHSSVCVRNL